jgi:hypothetical protein
MLGRPQQPHSRDNIRVYWKQYANQSSDGAMNATNFESAEPMLRWPIFSHTTTQGPWFTLTIHRSLCWRYDFQDTNIVDNAETVYISSLALLKMLRHGRAGVPMEVMGLMLGEFVDDYTVRVVDVFAMPQSGTGVSVEAVDPVFQTKMMDMLRQTGRYVISCREPFE